MNLKHRSIAGNTVLSILGQVLPALAAFIVLPALTRILGVERLGFLSLVWIVIGYFSLLDLGLGLGVTKSVAAAIGTDDAPKIPSVFWTAWITQCAMGCMGGLLLWFGAHLLAADILRVPDRLMPETVRALMMCAAVMPVIIMTPSVVGILQACHRFDLTVLIQSPFAVGQYVLPYFCARAGMNLANIIGVLLLSRVVSFLLLCWASATVFPGLLRHPAFSCAEFRSLIGFGSWVTIGTLIAPVVLYADRFIISRVLSLGNLAFYSVPADTLIRLLIVPASIVSVAFPSFSQLGAKADGHAVNALANRASRAVLYIMVLPLGALIVCGPRLMILWMGVAFASKASLVLQILVLGALSNSIARIPYGLLQALGRPDLPSKLQLIELPFQIALSYLLTLKFGLTGAAIAWSLRLTLELFILFYLTHRTRILFLSRAGLLRACLNGVLILIPAAILAVAIPSGEHSFACILAVVGWLAWGGTIILRRGLNDQDRTAVSRLLARAW